MRVDYCGRDYMTRPCFFHRHKVILKLAYLLRFLFILISVLLLLLLPLPILVLLPLSDMMTGPQTGGVLLLLLLPLLLLILLLLLADFV